MSSALNKLAVLRNDGVKSRRVSSFDRNGGNGDCRGVSPGETFTIAEIEGAGIIRHIWMTHTHDHDPMTRRNLILRMYWDGEENPSVEAPLGDFFGNGFGAYYNFMSLPLACAPRGGQSLVSYFPMPFEKGARITLENDGDGHSTFFYYIDYEEYDTLPEEMGRFHAFFNREFTQSPWEIGENEWACLSQEAYGKMLNKGDEENYMFADIEGKGHFVGVNYYIENPQPMWYGEGDDMFRIDGEDWPFSLHGTGTEDFFNTAWCPDEVYMHPYFGLAKIPWQVFGWLGRTHCYRFLLDDPIYFEKSLYASIEHGHANCLAQDISTVSYWYQTEPHKPYKPLPDKAGRNVRPETEYADVTRWRDAWIREMRSLGVKGPLWGKEQKPDSDANNAF